MLYVILFLRGNVGFKQDIVYLYVTLSNIRLFIYIPILDKVLK